MRSGAVVLYVLVFILAISLAAADRESLPVEDAKVYELIEIWDATIVPYPDLIGPSGAQVHSFREIESSTTKLTGYRYTPTYEDVEPFQDDSDVDHVLNSLTLERFSGVQVEVMHRGYYFSNKKYPKYAVERTQLEIIIPEAPNKTTDVYTILKIPRGDEFVVPQSVPDATKVQIFPGGKECVVLITGDAETVKLIVSDAMTNEDTQNVEVVSFYILPPPPPPEPEKEAAVQQPAVVSAGLPPPEESQPIAVYAFSLILVLAGGVLGMWYVKKKRMEDLILKYSGPQSHVQVTEVEKSHAKVFDHLHDVLKRIRRHHRNP